MGEAYYRRRLTDIYLEHAPHKVSTVGAMLTRYHGHEDEFLEQLEAKYEQVGNLRGQSTEWNTPSTADFGTLAPQGGQGGRAGYRRRLQVLYEIHAPHNLSTVDSLLDRFQGREEELIQQLEVKYEQGGNLRGQSSALSGVWNTPSTADFGIATSADPRLEETSSTPPVAPRIFAALCAICGLVSIIGIALTSIDIHPLARGEGKKASYDQGNGVLAARVGLVWDHDVGPVNETRYRAMTPSQRSIFAKSRAMTISFQKTGQLTWGGTWGDTLDLVVQTRAFERPLDPSGVQYEKKYLDIDDKLHTWKNEKSFGGAENPSYSFPLCQGAVSEDPSQSNCEYDDDKIPCWASKFLAVHADFCLTHYVNRHIQPLACAIQLETVVSTYSLLKSAWVVRLTGFCVSLIVAIVGGCLHACSERRLKEKPWIGGVLLIVPLLLFQFPGIMMALTANGRLDGMLTKTDMCPLQTETLQELGWENRRSYSVICTVLLMVCCIVPTLVYLVFSLIIWCASRNATLPAASAPVNIALRPYKIRVLRILDKYDPVKVNSVNELMNRFIGEEEDLIKKLTIKYGPEPSADGERAGGDVFSRAEVRRLRTENAQLRTDNAKLRAKIDEPTREPPIVYGPPPAFEPTATFDL